MAVVSLTKLFTRLILIVSPILAVIGGHGHCPLIPIIGRLNPSGDELTQPRFQFNVLVIGFGGFATLAFWMALEVETIAVEVDVRLDDGGEGPVVIVDSVVELLNEDVLDEESLVDEEDEVVETEVDDDDVLEETRDVDDDDDDDDDGAGATSPGVPPIRTRLSPVVT